MVVVVIRTEQGVRLYVINVNTGVGYHSVCS